MSEWWIDHSRPGPQPDSARVVTSAGNVAFYQYAVPGAVLVFEDSATDCADWQEDDEVYSNGEYVGRFIGYTLHVDDMWGATRRYDIKVKADNDLLTRRWAQYSGT